MALISRIKSTHDNNEYNVRDDVHVWGGRNLAKGSYNFQNWWIPSGYATVSGDTVTFAKRTSKSWVVIASPCIPAADAIGKDITVSFDIRSDDATDLNAESGYPAGGPGGTNYSTRTHSITGFNGNVSTNWERKSFTIKNIDYSTWTKNDGATDDWLCINVWLYQLNSVQFRHFKFEYGNKPTDWSPAPEDIGYVNSTELNLLS